MSGAAARTGIFIYNGTKLIVNSIKKRLLQNDNESNHRNENVHI